MNNLKEFNVYLNNDDIHSFEYVISSLICTFPGSMTEERAEEIAKEVHEAGRSKLFSGYLEHAEHFFEMMRFFNLCCSMEREEEERDE